MPYEVESPIGAGLGAAGAFLKSEEERRRYEDSEALKKQQAATDAATQAATAQHYAAQDSLTKAKGDQITALLPYLPAEAQGKIAKLVADGDLAGATALLRNAQTTTEGYKPALLTSETNRNNAQTTEILQGKLPLDQAEATYKKSLPGYNDRKLQFEGQQLQQKWAALGSADRRSANALAARLQIAGASQNERLLLAAATIANQGNNMSEKDAFQLALQDYGIDKSAWLDNLRADNTSRAAGGDGVPGFDRNAPPKPPAPAADSGGNNQMMGAIIAALLNSRGQGGGLPGTTQQVPHGGGGGGPAVDPKVTDAVARLKAVPAAQQGGFIDQAVKAGKYTADEGAKIKMALGLGMSAASSGIVKSPSGSVVGSPFGGP